MIVKLLTSTQTIHDMEYNAALAALTCHANTDKDFVPSEVLTNIIKKGHESVLEHINLTYSIQGLSRACLQELARHRHISLSVESTRHTLRKNVLDNMEKELEIYQELARHRHISLSVESTRHTLRKNVLDNMEKELEIYSPVNIRYLSGCFIGEKKYPTLGEFFVGIIRDSVERDPDLSNDELKYFIPEFWPTNLILTSNIRELRHIFTLRTAPDALMEFRVLAHSLFEVVPDEFKYLLKDCVHEEVTQ